MQSYCDEQFIGIELAGPKTLVDVQKGKCRTAAVQLHWWLRDNTAIFFPAYEQVRFDQWNNDAKKFMSPFGCLFDKLLPIFFGADEYDHLSFRYKSTLRTLGSHFKSKRRSVDLADWLVDTGLFNSVPLAHNPRCRESILCTLWIIRFVCIVIPLCAGIENFVSIWKPTQLLLSGIISRVY